VTTKTKTTKTVSLTNWDT